MRAFLDDLPDTYIPRGVYQLRGWARRDGESRPVLLAVTSSGRIRVRTVPASWDLDAAWDALERWLEEKDPVPRLRLVGRKAPPAPAPRIIEARRVPPPPPVLPLRRPPAARAAATAYDPYDPPPVDRRPITRKRAARAAHPAHAGEWTWDCVFKMPYRLGRDVPRDV